MKPSQNQKPATFAQQEKINAVKKHYADLMRGQAVCVGSEPAHGGPPTAGKGQRQMSKKKVYCRRGAGMSDEAPPVVEKVRSPYADKVWTVVNNSRRKNKWATYYDAGESPVDLLEEDEGSWAYRA
jgi:hypothetical protein